MLLMNALTYSSHADVRTCWAQCTLPEAQLPEPGGAAVMVRALGKATLQTDSFAMLHD